MFKIMNTMPLRLTVGATIALLVLSAVALSDQAATGLLADGFGWGVNGP